VTAAILRTNRDAEVIPFESKIVNIKLNPRDSIMTNAHKLSNLPCGGTNCSAPLRELNRRKASGDVVIYLSDNESWVDSPNYGCFGGSAPETMKQWNEFKSRNPDAKLVCIDMQPNDYTQAKERRDILNIGGFSDQVFSLVADFAAGDMDAGHWAGVIEKVEM
jgi:60 kDa SS-A/Ro ribonucleoprotein